MLMPENYYSNKLYPLQDKFLHLMNSLNTDFYLTGGTALSRFYLHHRYSDDLDFFVNNSNHFKENVSTILATKEIDFEVGVRDEMFVRIMLNADDCLLKIDFVNDIQYHSGDFYKTDIFSRIDNPLNILSNKISALQRNSPKDIADIVFICEKYNFSWVEIIEDAQKKDLWVNPIDVAMIIESFPVELLHEVKWIALPDLNLFSDKIKIIVKDIIGGKTNSIHK